MKQSRESRRKNSNTEPAISGVELGQLERLLDFMAEHGLEEFEYEHAGRRIRLKKAPGAVPGAATPRAAAPPVAPPQQPELAAAAPTAAPAPAPAAAPAAEELHVVKSPIVGTYYAAPGPGTPAFVKVGDFIHVGQVVCIVEAMKLMNEIESDVSGELVRALVENGQPVEYGQGLFAIRPDKKR